MLENGKDILLSPSPVQNSQDTVILQQQQIKKETPMLNTVLTIEQNGECALRRARTNRTKLLISI